MFSSIFDIDFLFLQIFREENSKQTEKLQQWAGEN